MAFKPNIYPLMYWALAYGVIAGVLLFLFQLLARFITLIWFPVFLVGLILGAWRNYRKQKMAFEAATGQTSPAQSPVAEFKEAARDIAEASQELIQQESVQAEAQVVQEEFVQEEVVTEAPIEPENPEQPLPPLPPQTPPTA